MKKNKIKVNGFTATDLMNENLDLNIYSNDSIKRKNSIKSIVSSRNKRKNDNLFKENHKYVSKKQKIRDKKELFFNNHYKSHFNSPEFVAGNPEDVSSYYARDFNVYVSRKEKYSKLENNGVFRDNNLQFVKIPKKVRNFSLEICSLNISFIGRKLSYVNYKFVDHIYDLKGLYVLQKGKDLLIAYKADNIYHAEQLVEEILKRKRILDGYGIKNESLIINKTDLSDIYKEKERLITFDIKKVFQKFSYTTETKTLVNALNDGTQYFYGEKVINGKGLKFIIGNNVFSLKGDSCDRQYAINKRVKEKTKNKKFIKNFLDTYDYGFDPIENFFHEDIDDCYPEYQVEYHENPRFYWLEEIDSNDYWKYDTVELIKNYPNEYSIKSMKNELQNEFSRNFNDIDDFYYDSDFDM